MHGGEVELRLADLDAHAGERVAGLVEQLGRVQQRLRRDAADIEAGAAEGRVLLDHRDLHAELRRADGADIAAGAGADDDEVVGGHAGTLLSARHQFVEFGLFFGIAPQAVGAGVDLPALVIDPKDVVSVIPEFNLQEVLRSLQPPEHPPL